MMTNLFRILGAFIIVFGSYNPSGYSFVHWALIDMNNEMVPLKALVGITLFIGWAFYLYSTKMSLGWFGTILAAIFFGIIFWLLIDFKIIGTSSVAIIWIAEAIMALVMSAGMLGARIRRWMSGQYSVDDVEE
jgi:hypothetical protein